MSALVSPIASLEIAGVAMAAMCGDLGPEARVRLLLDAARNTLNPSGARP